jgi:anaphase-promoting complex subunit 2
LAVSKGYWPINYEAASTLQIPSDFKGVFDEYSRLFSKIKAMRKISFHYNLGHVNLTLTFDNGSFDFKCLPIQAIMITYFDESKIKDINLGVSSE